MDTTTHVTIGIGLAGLSFFDPTVAGNPELTMGILACTIIGSNAPDIDCLYKLKGNETYVQHHRGLSHSLPVIMLLATIIATIMTLFYSGSYFFTFFTWSLVAVVLHVIVDICNIYGTQALRPFTKKWLALNVLPIFDPTIMILHIVGFIAWAIGFPQALTFAFIYLLISCYVLLRIVKARNIVNALKHNSKNGETYTLIPTFSLNSWTVIASGEENYRLGKYEKETINWLKTIEKTSDENQIIKAAKQNHFIHHLLQYSPYLHAKIVKIKEGYEVHWFDLRYQSRIDEPFVAIIYLDQQLNLIKSYVKRGLISVPEKI
jgi:inner membrane protein